MLGGSLGMFGFPRASDAACALELELAMPARLGQAPTLSTLVAIVRRGLGARAFAAQAPDTVRR
jgi:hypothetical protein